MDLAVKGFVENAGQPSFFVSRRQLWEKCDEREPDNAFDGYDNPVL